LVFEAVWWLSQTAWLVSQTAWLVFQAAWWLSQAAWWLFLPLRVSSLGDGAGRGGRVGGRGCRVGLGQGLAGMAMRLPVRLLACAVAVVGGLAAGAAAARRPGGAGGAGFGGEGQVQRFRAGHGPQRVEEVGAVEGGDGREAGLGGLRGGSAAGILTEGAVPSLQHAGPRVRAGIASLCGAGVAKAGGKHVQAHASGRHVLRLGSVPNARRTGRGFWRRRSWTREGGEGQYLNVVVGQDV